MTRTDNKTFSPLADPERIAFAGDWHANGNWAPYAAQYAADQGADVIVHVGDFGYLFKPSYLASLSLTLSNLDLHLLFVDGNHEDHQWLRRQPVNADGIRPIARRIFHLPRGFRWTWQGVRFLALGGAHSVDGTYRRSAGHLWQSEEAITATEAVQATAGGPADVLISHDCPTGVEIPGLAPPGTFPEDEIRRSEEHRRILRHVVDQVKPSMIWHGHYHSAYASIVDLGWGPVSVFGLDMDGTTLGQNIDLVDMSSIKAIAQAGAQRRRGSNDENQ